MYRFSFKRTFRNWRLFLAILTGILISTTLFASANVGGTVIISAMLDKTLEDIPLDMVYEPSINDIYGFPNSTVLQRYRNLIEGVDDVIGSEVVVRHLNWSWDGEEKNFFTTGILENSTIYNGITDVVGAPTIGVNETYIVTSSDHINDFPIGSNYTIHSTAYRGLLDPLIFNMTLTVVGHVEITDAALTCLIGGAMGGYAPLDLPWIQYTYFIVDLEKTFLPFLDEIGTYPGIEWVDTIPNIYIYLDRSQLINPYDITSSIQTINQIEQRLRNLLGFNVNLFNILSLQLGAFSNLAENQKYTFLMVSLPVFFIALYMGITLNDVSFSLRRREVGLYLTKGQTRGQIISMFVAEGFLIGLLASFIGLGLSFVIVPFFIGTGIYTPVNPLLIGIDTVFLTFAFGIGIAMIATYLPARKAVQIPTAEALREHTIVGEQLDYPRLLAWTCLGLGAYKIVVWGLGINVSMIFLEMIFTNPMLSFLISIWLLIDIFLGYVGPLLFFYGLTTILVKGSPRFHDYATRFIRRIMGDLGGLAAHTIRRRPGRTAAVLFILALLVGYGVQTVGVIASQRDYVNRDIYADVGSDLRVNVRYPENATDLLPAIRAIEGVKGAARELRFSMITTVATVRVRAINVSEWIDVAYWEPGWFPIQPMHLALESLATDNQSIILERFIAVQLGLALGDTLSVPFSIIGQQDFTVAGYFGPEPVRLRILIIDQWLAEPTWSYIPLERLEELSPPVSPTGSILVSLTSPIVNDEVVTTIKALDDVASVDSAIDQIEGFNSDIFLNANINIMQMSLLFGFLLASLGTIVIVYLTLRERRRSTALMSARGMTYRQTVSTLMAESLTIIGLAIILGLSVGLIVLYGQVQAANPLGANVLVLPRFFPAPYVLSMVLQLSGFLALLVVSSVIPIIVEAYQARYDVSVLR